MTLEKMRNGLEAPIPFAEIVEVTEASFAVLESIATGQPVELAAFRAAPSDKPSKDTAMLIAHDQAG